MPTTINASNTTGGAVVTGDGSGILELQSGGVTGLTVNGQNVTVAGTVTATGGLTSPVNVSGNSTAGAEIRLPEDTDNGSNYVALKAADSLAANLTFTLPSADGTNGQVLLTNGAGGLSFGAAANIQTFAATGTWTKPAGAQFVLVETWGAGGGGGRPTAGAANPAGAGGGGGAYNYKLFSASTLPSSVPVVIGAGGAGASTNGGNGSAGGNTNFGSLIFAYGGAGGAGNTTGTSYQTGGTGGGMSSTTGFRISDAVSGSIITTQIAGGGSGGGTFTSGATTLNQVNGSASLYGGGGGAGAQTGVSPNGGGASLYGGGGGGAGGSSTAGGSSSARDPSIGGGSIPTTTASSSEYFGACGGGQVPIYGIASPPAADFLLGGGGGQPAQSAPTVTPYQIATNGAQTVVLARVTIAGFAYASLLVSSNGLSTYTTYLTTKCNPSGGNIIYDGSKYVILSLGKFNGIYNSSFWYASSTTDFINFTDYPLSGIPSSATISSTVRSLFYLNGRYLLCTGQGLYSSTDLITWSLVLSASTVKGVAFDGTYYYALAGATVHRSTNLSSWTSAASGAGTTEGIDASPSLVIVTSSSTNSRYSTDQGQTWSNLPTIPSASGYAVKYVSSTNTWLIGSSSPANSLYYSTTPTVSWTQSASAVLANGTEATYNGTYYVTCPTAGTTNAAFASATTGGTFTAQTFSAFPTAASPGGPGGIAGGGGGGAASSTTTTNGGNGGNGYCRVYTW